ncbi:MULTISPECIES: GNAT family N-acetyltransferase [Clostridium]|uniref:GNAT family N-acetyltransferase n=1 Tax=Clostridium TaxID=1485 RepID=UPI0013E92973|nr:MULTISPECIES: GNAT family N-acetyltransferase [Clostridium]MBU3143840.1 GNAT family N-acetyltransferase [Clostridium sp. CF012]MBZ9687446.1 GNAT family N-acetyltransferase [Clostridium estertheticum]
MYKIHYANVDDARILGEIHSKSWKVAYKGIVPEDILNNMSSEKRQRYFEKALSEGWEEDAIIFKENIGVGLICIGKCRDEDKDNSYGEIWGIYLLPEYFNKGIGSKLIYWGLNELRNRNYKKITLWVLEENTPARKFYEKIGFNHDGTVKEITIGKKLKEYRYVKIIE